MADSDRSNPGSPPTIDDITGHSAVGSHVTRFQYNKTNLIGLIEVGKAKIDKLDRDYRERRAELRGRVAQLEELLKALEASDRAEVGEDV